MWVDFRALRKSLSFEAVLKHYGVTIKPRQGNRHVGFCPLPKHQGNRKTPSFSAKLDIGVFQCFGCKASGHILTFAALMEGLDPENPQDLRKIALKLQERFGAPAFSPAPKKEPSKPPVMVASNSHEKSGNVVNPPLDFELKDLDTGHPYLKERGFSAETTERFGLGYCNRGMMKGRIVIPLHNAHGQLIGYAGRITDEKLIGPDCPKYLLPGKRERGEQTIEFRKSLFLYRGFEVHSPVDDLIVVEGFPATWWLKQLGYESTVAIMGSDCSVEQAALVVKLLQPDGRLWIMSDEDVAGEKCASRVLSLVGHHRWCKRVRYNSVQPTDCSEKELSAVLWQR